MPNRDARPTGVRTRLRTVLDLVWESDDRAAFYKGDGGVRIVVPYDTWHEMGRPKQVTLTIEPGDQLST